jgi:predicted AAA+ superfamily ATPase
MVGKRYGIAVEYVPRVVDAELDELMAALPAIALEGAKGVGKTATATRRAAAVFPLDDRDVAEVVSADLSQLETEPGTVLVDEWQRHPPVWDHVRRQVDAGAPPGRFLLAGSAAPAEAPVHSGAGRIVAVRMRPFSLAERGLAVPVVSLARMVAGERPGVAGTTSAGLADYVEEILASGFPALRRFDGRARRSQLEGYLTRMVERDFPDQGLRVRRPGTLRAWLAAYAAATATTASYNTILDAATPGETDKPAKTTTIAYREVLSQLWLLDPTPGWTPGGGRLSRLTQAPRHHLADPALAAHLLGVDAGALLRGKTAGPAVPRDGSLLGALFESLVSQSVKVYAQAAEATVSHLRTRDGRHEVDLIVERPDGRVVALEVKLAGAPDTADLRHVLWLRQQLGDDLVDAAVVTAGTRAWRRPDGIAVIPAALLGP